MLTLSYLRAVVFFFKQKTAYEMRISDWSSDVCSSDLLTPLQGFSFRRESLEDRTAIEAAFADFKPQRVVNLAAQAGVRYSLENPHAYIYANIVGFTNILESCHHTGVEPLV